VVTENGIVVRTEDRRAWIKTIRASTCEGCGSRDLCQGGKECEVEVANTAGAGVGDEVVIGFASGSLVKITFLLYMVPVLAMIAGAAIGLRIAPTYGVDESAMSAAMAFGSLGLAFLFIRLFSGKLAGNEKFQARILRIRARARTASA
jgi:sigma-E factor negative regulatory protein RseC